MPCLQGAFRLWVIFPKGAQRSLRNDAHRGTVACSHIGNKVESRWKVDWDLTLQQRMRITAQERERLKAGKEKNAEAGQGKKGKGL